MAIRSYAAVDVAGFAFPLQMVERRRSGGTLSAKSFRRKVSDWRICISASARLPSSRNTKVRLSEVIASAQSAAQK
jgi:hypothetical protein